MTDTAPPPTDQDAPTQRHRQRNRQPIGGRTPPHDTAAERSLLGAMMLSRNAIENAVRVGVDPKDFYGNGNAAIYQACTDIHGAGQPADPVTVASHLNAQQLPAPPGVDSWAAYLSDLITHTPTISNAAAYAKIVKEKAESRSALWQLAEAVDAGTQAIYDGEPAADTLGNIAHRLQAGTVGEQRALLRTYTPTELAEMDLTLNWLVRGMYASPTYGMTAGEMKTGKSTISNITALSLAAGLPIFGHFKVDKAAPVVIYVGEGGKVPHARLLERLAGTLGVDWRDLPIYIHYELAPINSARFQRTLKRDLDEYRPGLVIIDPYYSFHGGNADARNLHEEAEVLNALSAPCVDAGCVLDIVNHFNRGEGKGVKRITMAGGGEWVDTWRLLAHREPADVDTGQLKLRLEIGSRQWGGTTWDLDLNLGRFNPELGNHEGDITWNLQRPQTKAGGGAELILRIVENEPWRYTKEQLAKRSGMRLEDARSLIYTLDGKGITARLSPVEMADGRTRQMWVFGPTSDPGDARDGQPPK